MALDWVESWRLILPNHCTGTCEHGLGCSGGGRVGLSLALGVALTSGLAAPLLAPCFVCGAFPCSILCHTGDVLVWADNCLGIIVPPGMVGFEFGNAIFAATSKTPIGDLPAQLLLLWVLILLESPFALTGVGVDKGKVVRVVRANSCSRETLRLKELLATS